MSTPTVSLADSRTNTFHPAPVGKFFFAGADQQLHKITHLGQRKRGLQAIRYQVRGTFATIAQAVVPIKQILTEL